METSREPLEFAAELSPFEQTPCSQLHSNRRRVAGIQLKNGEKDSNAEKTEV